jgi:hypothetical protein
MNRVIYFSIFILYSSLLQAEVVIEDRVNSWASPGFLWVVSIFVIITIIIAISTWLNKKK